MSVSTYFNKITRKIYNDESFKELPPLCKWLYTVLVENESRFADKEGWFFRSDDDLAMDAGISDKTLKKYKKILRENGLVETSIMHFTDKDTNKKSKKKVTAYRIKDT